jgi:hypothetical protein
MEQPPETDFPDLIGENCDKDEAKLGAFSDRIESLFTAL